MGDPESLSNLRDLAFPPAVSFWPPAPGIWIVAAGTGAVAMILALRGVRSYQANAYRRAGLAELGRLTAAIGQDECIAERAAALLKRAALAAFPRETVASLSGPAWVDFLVRTAGRGFDAGPVRNLLSRTYDDALEPDADTLRSALAQVRIWLRRHRRADPDGGR